jgi:hypothetical protein
MPPRMTLSVTRLVTFAPRGNPAAVGRTPELLIEPSLYSILALPLLANIASMPPPTVQPSLSRLPDAPKDSPPPVDTAGGHFPSHCHKPMFLIAVGRVFGLFFLQYAAIFAEFF